MTLSRKLAAEFIGTLWLVLGGCGSAVLAAAFPELGIGFAGVSLAFGLTVLTMAYAIGHISGCHLNPAVSVGLWAGKRFPASELLPYIIAQVIGAIAGAGILYVIASGKPGFSTAGGFASNGYDAHSPGGYAMIVYFVAEAVFTFFFLIIILGSTHHHAPQGFVPIAIGLGLTLIHLSKYSRNQYIGQSGAKHGTGYFRRWLGNRSALAILGCTDHRGGDCGILLLLAGRRPRGQTACYRRSRTYYQQQRINLFR